MRRDNIFWGGVLILFGVLFLLQAQGIINNVFRFFWPLILMMVGVWMIVNVFWKPALSADETFTIPLREAKSVSYKFAHGAAQMEIAGGAPSGTALVGASAAGMNQQSQLNGDRLDVKVAAGPSLLPFIGPMDGVAPFSLGVPRSEIRLPGSRQRSEAQPCSGGSIFPLQLRHQLTGRLYLVDGANAMATAPDVFPGFGLVAAEIHFAAGR